MAEALKLFLNITAGDLASHAINNAVANIKKMGDASDVAGKKLKALETSFKLFSASALAMGAIGSRLIPDMKESANLDRDLTRIKQTAGYTREETDRLRKSLFDMSELRGTDFGDLMGGLEVLSSKGLKFDETLGTMKAINEATAITGASAETLANSLAVAAHSFDFDLSKPGVALSLLEKMTVAGRAGSLEIEDMAGKLPVFAGNAKAAGFSLEKSMAMAEAFSKYVPDKDRLGTLMDSTLRLWTNGRYAENAHKASGVDFYDSKGAARGPEEVMADMKKKFDNFRTKEEQDAFITATFQSADQDTINGWRKILSGSIVPDMHEIEASMMKASGTFVHDMPEAMANAVNQSARLKNSMRGMTDEFSRPFNKFIADGIDQLMGFRKAVFRDPDKAGAQVMTAGVVGGTALVMSSFAKMVFDRFGLGDAYRNATGMTAGKAAAEAMGITPVFVTNFGDSPCAGGGKINLGKSLPIPTPGLPTPTVVPNVPKGILAGARGLLAGAGGLLESGLAGWLPGLGASGLLGASVGGIGAMGAGAVAGSGALLVGAGVAGYGIGTALDKLTDSLTGGAWTESLSNAIAYATSDSYRKMIALQQNNLSVQTNVTVDTNGKKLAENTVTKQTASGAARNM